MRTKAGCRAKGGAAAAEIDEPTPERELRTGVILLAVHGERKVFGADGKPWRCRRKPGMRRRRLPGHGRARTVASKRGWPVRNRLRVLKILETNVSLRQPQLFPLIQEYIAAQTCQQQHGEPAILSAILGRGPARRHSRRI